MSLSLPSSGPTSPATTEDGSLGSPLGRAATLMVGFLAVLWVVELINAATGRQLSQSGGIRPRDAGSLVDIVFAPFLHGSLEHLAGNALPLFSLGLIAALTGWKRFLTMTGIVILVSGIGVWLFSPDNSISVGASGVVFGYFGYLLVRGLVDRRPVDLVVSIGVALSFGYVMWHSVGFGENGISWQGHVSGLIGGVLAALVLHQRRLRVKSDSATEQLSLPSA